MERIGKQPARYQFLLNPHEEMRLSRCPTCQKLTYPRKFALLIHVEGFGPYVQGKTCKYCSACEMIICDQLELETELTSALHRLQPDLIGNEYLVLGTMDLKTWKTGLSGATQGLGAALAHVAEFKKHLDIDFDPGGWIPAGAGRSRRIIKHATALARLVTPWRPTV
jgi:hypothetical protein